MALDVTIKHEEFVETSNGAHCARNRRRGKTISSEARDPLPQITALEFNHRFFVGNRPTVEPGQIACVALERVARKTFFNLDVGKEFFYEVAIIAHAAKYSIRVEPSVAEQQAGAGKSTSDFAEDADQDQAVT